MAIVDCLIFFEMDGEEEANNVTRDSGIVDLVIHVILSKVLAGDLNFNKCLVIHK